MFKLVEICEKLDYSKIKKEYVRSWRKLDPETMFIILVYAYQTQRKPRKKQMKVHVPKAVKTYEEQLHQEINEDRDDHGKKALEKETYSMRGQTIERVFAAAKLQTGSSRTTNPLISLAFCPYFSDLSTIQTENRVLLDSKTRFFRQAELPQCGSFDFFLRF